MIRLPVFRASRGKSDLSGNDVGAVSAHPNQTRVVILRLSLAGILGVDDVLK